ncbi:outer membrane beta-barrel protein [Flavobacterium hercynium]|uniref:Outer membrane protein beta-barrel domain-containing protein n=1 Tax=Flavobacterium hercynium TaxID=387094 RepID=A0A226HLQ1_9FLAO|nr:outer membrane beta-barrel protein [Flavobacterium hercynium]OXA94400.1 hypothetical protein B0A66_04905 [Flavobacterium hercynium]SMP29565.1 Outer membrane protein beta-barrel domain-containing protein [Flavobacterium hercynium]
MKKKNFAIVIIIALLAITNLQAQVTFKPGINAGLNIATLTNSELNAKADFYIGAFGAIKFSKFYTLQPEITYSRQGGKGNVVMETDDYNYPVDRPLSDPSLINPDFIVQRMGNVNVSLQYISSLTINKFHFNEKFYVLVGPFLDILITDNIKVSPEKYKKRYTKDADVDLGIVGGLGYSLNKNIAFETRVKKGVVGALINQNDYSGSGRNNLVYQFGIAYTFSKK